MFMYFQVQVPVTTTNPMLAQLQAAAAAQHIQNQAQQRMQAALSAMQNNKGQGKTAQMWLQQAPAQTAPFVVYAISCNEKLYVGQTSDLRQRLQSHNNKPPSRVTKALQTGQKLHHCSEVLVLHQVQTETEAKRLEKMEILCRRTTESAFGYNILKGTPACDAKYYHIRNKKWCMLMSLQWDLSMCCNIVKEWRRQGYCLHAVHVVFCPWSS